MDEEQRMAKLRQEKMEQQRRILEMKQKQKRRCQGMVQASDVKPNKPRPILGQINDESILATTSEEKSIKDFKEYSNESAQPSAPPLATPPQISRMVTFNHGSLTAVENIDSAQIDKDKDSIFSNDSSKDGNFSDDDDKEDDIFKNLPNFLSQTLPEDASSKEIKSEMAAGDAKSFDDLLTNLSDFVRQPCPKDGTVHCRVLRNKQGVDKRLFPTYYMHFEKDDGKKVFLLAGRKRKKSATSSYLISTDPADISQSGKSIVAKLKSNLLGTAFTVVETNASSLNLSVKEEDIRKELAAVVYETNVLGFKGPRKMTVILPNLPVGKDRNFIKCPPEENTLIRRWNAKHLENLTVLCNKQPAWSDGAQSFVLNFSGRVTQASVKNFQIVHESDEDYVIVQFGRVAENIFTLDYRYPMCALQAFGIALSSFDNKIACE